MSGLKGPTFDEKLEELGMETLEERRHQKDKQQTYKILYTQDRVDRAAWFEMAAASGRVTRTGGGSTEPESFYSQRVPTRVVEPDPS